MRLADMEAFVTQAEREAAGLEDVLSDVDNASDLSDADKQGSKEKASKGLIGSDLGSDDDDDLEALLTSSAALVGKQRGSSKARQQTQQEGQDADSDMEGLADGIDSEHDIDADMDPGQMTYKDFFGANATADGVDDSDGGVAVGRDEYAATGFDDDRSNGQVHAYSDEEQQRARGAGSKGKAAAKQAGGAVDLDDDSDEHNEIEQQPLSTHEKRLLRMQERIAELEEKAMVDKPWHLVGEVSAARRPINSALEIDMEYDTTSKPPPAPTEESTQGLEDIIRRRIAESRFDDVVRVVPPPAEIKKRQLVELDDNKAQQGLGEVYESEYVQQATGFTAPDKQEPLRAQAKALFQALCAKLDALSSFIYTPKPVIQELEVRSDVAALALEEVAPLVVSDAALRTPGEVFAAEAKGEGRAEAELTREERRRRRAKKKRGYKAKEAATEAAAAAWASAAGDSTALAGRKSLAKQLAAATSSGLIKKGMAAGGDWGKVKSAAVFGKLAEQQAAGAAGKGGGSKAGSSSGKGDKQINSSILKL
eukprot:GHRR01007950.1.p1 GENE.GHRR01007950.1~~GHRR01007950.1.p1  ORF type:complete len:537 (+),score=268.55 GHRR01007950.1:389-1999(+)